MKSTVFLLYLDDKLHGAFSSLENAETEILRYELSKVPEEGYKEPFLSRIDEISLQDEDEPILSSGGFVYVHVYDLYPEYPEMNNSHDCAFVYSKPPSEAPKPKTLDNGGVRAYSLFSMEEAMGAAVDFSSRDN